MAHDLPSECEVRPLRWDDADEAARLLTAAMPWGPTSVEVVRKDWSRPRFDLGRDTRAVIASDRLVGFGIAYPEGLIDVAVAAEWQGRGLGFFLSDFVEQRARDEGHTEVGHLVDAADERAQQFWAARGYQRVDTYRTFSFPVPSPSDSVALTFRRVRGRSDDAAIHSLLLEEGPDFGMDLAEWQEWIRIWEDDEQFWLLAEDGGELRGAVIGRRYPEHGFIKLLLLRAPHDLELGRQLCLAVGRELGRAGSDRVTMNNPSGTPHYVEPVLRQVGAELVGALDQLSARL